MEKRIEIRLAGEGGQGMILAGIILAEAAAIYRRQTGYPDPKLWPRSARRRQPRGGGHLGWQKSTILKCLCRTLLSS